MKSSGVGKIFKLMGQGQGRRHDVLSGGDGDMVNQNYLAPKFMFPSDLGHSIFKMLKMVNYFDKLLEKYKMLAKTGGDYPLHHGDWRGRDSLHPPCGATHGQGCRHPKFIFSRISST